MSYCPEHGDKMVCRNPDAYDGLVYDCPEGHTMVYEDGAYTDSTHPAYADMDFAQSQEESTPHTQAYSAEDIPVEYPEPNYRDVVD